MHRLNVGGPTYHATYLTRYLNRSKFETRLYSGNIDQSEKDGEYILREHGVVPIYVPHMFRRFNPIKDFRAFLFILQELRRFKPDIFHSHASKAGAIGRIAAYICGVPVIIHTYHGNVFSNYWGSFISAGVRTIEKFLARLTNRIIVISDLQFDEIVGKHKICKKEKASIIYLGLDLMKFNEIDSEKIEQSHTILNKGKDEYAIGIIGRLDPVKNHNLFLEMIAISKKISNKHIRGYIIGDGALRESLEKKCDDLNLKHSYKNSEDPKTDIVFLSWQSDLTSILPGLDILTLTSFNEGTPVSLIEGQAARLPIISTDVGGVKDIIAPHKLNQIVEGFDPVDFAKALIKIIENLEKYDRPDNKKILKNFHYKRLINDIENLYHYEIEKRRMDKRR